MRHDLTQGPIARHILNLAVPASVGFFFQTMYNVVDQVCAGRLISEQALASLTIAFPVFFILIAVSHGLYAGGAALVSNAVGEGDEDKARQFTGQVISAGILSSFVVMIVGWGIAPSLFRVLGAEGAYLEMALDYMNIIFGGTLFFLMANVLNVPLMARGNTKVFRNSLIVGFLLNAVLDPLFIMLGYGIRGIALATVVIQMVNALYIGWSAIRAGCLCRKTLSFLFPNPACQRELMRYSIPASLNMATVAIGIFVVTYFVSGFGVAATAAYGLAMRVEQIALLPGIGLNIAVLSIVGQNYGAGRMDRVKEAITVSLKFGFILWVMGGSLILFGGNFLMRMFLDERVVMNADLVLRTGASYLWIAAITLWAYVILFIVVNALQGMKRPMFAIWIGIYRQLLAPVACIHLLTSVWGFELYGVWWGVFISTWSGAIIAWLFMRHILRTMEECGIPERI